MPIIIAPVNTGVTINEDDGIIGRTIDGLTAMANGDHVTNKEHFDSMVAMGLMGVAAGSMWGRKNAAAGAEPLLGVFG